MGGNIHVRIEVGYGGGRCFCRCDVFSGLFEGVPNYRVYVALVMDE